ncbi:hypothetical protein PHISCL_06193 [Aspergillus sclerotialis]|uniref:Uncharacterized protein n=1 Tax=Aspergillus sclerotialis TaxID=2070753 RepID=A0A3A2ZJ88_9EURO|nr:hypothetical protein PHISCL_06193 [Aspergillus sclerotialis]
MSSYKHDGRLPRPRDLVCQCRDTPSASMTQPSFRSVPVSHSPRPQLARSMNSPPTNVRTSSSSAVEESCPALAPSKLPGSSPVNNARQSLLPRPAGQSIPLKTHRHPTNPSPTGQSIQRSSGHAMSKPYTSRNDIEIPANVQPKNVLRRKAPIIGQHTESGRPRIEATRPEKLSVIIPSDHITGHARNTTPQTPFDHVERDRKASSQSTREVNTALKITEFQPGHGPKELASLRTTVNTQNLPPPTPTFPTTSSPSTRYSGSPGIWSRTSTPTSLSSCSPGIIHPVKFGYRSRQPNSSQTRLPVFSPSIQSSPQIDRSNVDVRKSPNSTKEAELNSSPSKIEHAGTFQGMDSTKTAPMSRGPSHRNLPLRSNLPMRANSDTEALQSQVDEAERNAFDPRKISRTRTADPEVGSAQAPSRPSREGTHSLELEPSPIIQSNLPPYSLTNHKRRESGDNLPTVKKQHSTPTQSAAASVDSFQSRGSSRIPPRTTTSPVILKKSRRTLAKEEAQKDEVKSPAKSKRFALFPRKSTTEIAPEQARPTRKGPAAGTGYEGYGKYGQPGRRTSVSSNGSAGRSTSTVGSGTKPGSTRGSGKNRSDFELDDFLMDRLEPVVINGGGMDGSALSRVQSADSASGLSTASSSFGEHSKVPFSACYSTDSVATSLGIGDKPVSAESGISNASNIAPPRQRIGRQEADSGDRNIPSSHAVAGKASEKPSSRTNKSTVSFPFFYDQDSSVTALPQSTSTLPPTHRGRNVALKHEKAQTQKGKFSKWNFFQRSRGTERKHRIPQTTSSPTPQLPATISSVRVNRPVAHYAFVDGDSDPLEDIMHRVEESPPTEDEDRDIRGSVEVPAGLNIRKLHESVLLPSPPQMQVEFHKSGPRSPTVFFNKSPSHDHSERSPEHKRRSRLESIGRIPHVVSKREREHRPALESFSRPFSVTDTPSLPAPVAQRRDQHMSTRDASNIHTSAPSSDQTKFGYDLTQPFGDPLQKSALDFLSGPYSNNEFLTFSRKGSDQSSSSSGGLSAITAVAPNSSTDLSADEVWREYDDLIDHWSPETSMSTAPTNSNLDGKFELATMASKTLQSELNGKTEKQVPPVLVEHSDGPSDRDSSGSNNDIVRLRRSRITPALQSPIPSSSQPSYSDIIAA